MVLGGKEGGEWVRKTSMGRSEDVPVVTSTREDISAADTRVEFRERSDGLSVPSEGTDELVALEEANEVVGGA
jgi:hypothetical protein